jgi:hypothetical protein
MPANFAPDIFHAPLNEVLELVRLADQHRLQLAYVTALYNLGFDLGYDFGAVNSEAVGRQFKAILAAAEFVGATRAAYGQRPIAELTRGIQDGRESFYRQLEGHAVSLVG